MPELDVFKIDEANADNQKEYNRRRERELDDLKKILKIPEGRRFVLRVLGEAGMFHASFSLNSMQTSFNEGKRDIGLWLMKDLDSEFHRSYKNNSGSIKQFRTRRQNSNSHHKCKQQWLYPYEYNSKNWCTRQNRTQDK